MSRRERIVLILLLAAQAGLVLYLFWQSVPMRPKRPVLTVLTLPLEQVHARFSPYGPGVEQESVMLFCRRYGFTPRWVSAATWQEAGDLLLAGKADLLVAPGIMSHDLADDPMVRSGPAYEEHFPVFIHNQYRFGLDSPYSMCDKPVVVTDNPRLLESMQREIRDIPCEPQVEVWEEFSLRGILKTLSRNLLKLVLVDSGRFRYWEPFFPELRRTQDLNRPVAYRWHWRTDQPDIDEALKAFWKRFPDSRDFQDIRELYTGFLPRLMDYYEINHLASTIEQKLPQFQEPIITAARAHGLDPLLVVALIYQESRFEPLATSRTGVRGLMQITRDTAQHLGLEDRLDPVSSIEAGCRYLRDIWERFEGKGLPRWERWFLTLTAYNQGYNHTLDAMLLAEELDKDPARWSDMKTVFPMLSYSKYYSRLQWGYARGFEAVDFVESIRFYYYLLQGFVVLGRPEAQHLAPMLEARPGSWP